MAEGLVSTVLEQLVSFVGQQIVEEWNLFSGIEGNVQNLTTNLEAIQAVLEDAEKRQIKEASTKLWLRRLKEVSFEIDAVLDEWNTDVFRSNLGKEPPSGKVCVIAQSSCIRDPKVHRVGLRRRIACKIETLNDKLNNISTEKERYVIATHNLNRNSFEATRVKEYERPKTTALIDVSKVHGREIEKEILIDKLLSESSQAAGVGHDIIPIVGMGGIGKTTLAQLAYNDKRVSAHFNLKIWVCVSEPFDEVTIARAILETVYVEGSHELFTLQGLFQRIHESIRGKRFLLVLDDVWCDNDTKWEQLENSLRSGSVGSKVLVTTRKEKVATIMRAEKHMITLQSLSVEVCWSIFSQLAFLDKDKCEQLGNIGKKIALKCKGLPLVAKTLGSLMRFKKYTKENWEEVLHSELWKLEDIEDKIFVPLLFSYYDLPPLEKLCFLYCACFPRDHTIDRDELIQLWVSEGYLNIKKDYKGKGINCFENLAMRSLFQDFERDEDGNIVRCKMHDIVHDFVLFLTKNECLNTRVSLEKERMELEKEPAFHCTLLLESGAQVPTSVYNKNALRSLCITNFSSQASLIRWDLLLKLTCLRTLTLHDCSFAQLPKNIDKLIHLRYLSLRTKPESLTLPENLCNLFNLQTLKLSGCARELPEGINKLVNLHHLYIDNFIKVPKGLGELTCLETLDCFRVATGLHDRRFKRQMKLEDLNKLNHLKGSLSIMDIGQIKDVGEAERAQLKEKRGLVDLLLIFHIDFDDEGRVEKSTSLLEGLQPHSNLKRLEIRYYIGDKVFPGWMTSLINLKSLELSGCFNVKCLGPFGKMLSLESLTLHWMSNIKSIGAEFLGIEANPSNTTEMENRASIISFPRLKQLQFKYLENWEVWEDPSCSGSTIMPRLLSLTIEDCKSLKAPLPEFLQRTPLKNLNIRKCPRLEQLCPKGLGTDERVKIFMPPTPQAYMSKHGVETSPEPSPQIW